MPQGFRLRRPAWNGAGQQIRMFAAEKRALRKHVRMFEEAAVLQPGAPLLRVETHLLPSPISG
jgi:hypothetical protein